MLSASSAWNRVNRLTGYSKAGVILAGYTAAFLAASAACYVLAWLLPGPDPAGGMQAFGDLLRFFGIFAFLALFPSVLAVVFLRPVEKFWRFFSILSLGLAASGPAAAHLVGKPSLSPSAWVGLFALCEVLGAPLLCLTFAFCAAMAPAGRARRLLLAASAIELAVSAYFAYCLLFVGHWLA